MVYECDECCAALPADAVACPRCGEAFDEPVPSDATLPRRGFSAVPSPSTIILGSPLTAPAAQNTGEMPFLPSDASFRFSPPPAPREVVLFQSSDVTITLTRAVLGGRTYAMGNITSVSMATLPPDRSAGGTAAVFGALLAGVSAYLAFPPGIPIGVVIIVLACVLEARKKKKHLVRIGTLSAKLNVLSSYDPAYVRKIVNAMNEVITLRG